MKFSETYKGQPVFKTNEPWKIGYIKNLALVEYEIDRYAGTVINTIEDIYVTVEHFDYDQEYHINELTPAKGNI